MATPIATETTPIFEAPGHWRAIDLLSDLHLAENTPHVFDAWAAHMLHSRADAVFILGDLFEVWIGDDMAERGFEARCVAVLRAAAARTTVAFLPGNRDFLVGDAMLASAGVARLADPTVVVAFGTRVVVSHGDALCIDDLAYQRYRAVVRRPALQRAFGALPFGVRSAVGRALRRRSGRREPPPGGGFIDVDAQASIAMLRAAGAPTLVHGHTHAPRSHELAPGLVRHVLSDWELDGSSRPRAEVVRWSERGFERIAPETADAVAAVAAARAP